MGRPISRLAWLALLIACHGCSTPPSPEPTDVEPVVNRPSVVFGQRPGGQERTFAGTPLAASQIMVHWEGTARSRSSRTQQEALERAEDLRRRLEAGEDFGDLAREYSDGPRARAGGRLGVFGSEEMLPEFSAAVMALEIGELSQPVETEFGYHLIRREVVEQIGARHILIQHKKSTRNAKGISRTEEEASQICHDLLERIRDGESLERLAREYSEDTTAAVGGDIGKFGIGQTYPLFEDAAFALKPGELSGVVETPFGCHIIERYDESPSNSR